MYLGAGHFACLMCLHRILDAAVHFTESKELLESVSLSRLQRHYTFRETISALPRRVSKGAESASLQRLPVRLTLATSFFSLVLSNISFISSPSYGRDALAVFLLCGRLFTAMS